MILGDVAGTAGAAVAISVVATGIWAALESVLSHRREMASPRRVLARRLAEGEITELEYLGALQLLAAVPEDHSRRRARDSHIASRADPVGRRTT